MVISLVSSGGYKPPAIADAAPTVPPVASTPSAKPSLPVESPATAVQAAPAPPKRDHIKEAVDRANEVVKTMTKDLEFTVDHDTGIRVVKVVDTQTKEVIRQIPSEETVELAKAIDKQHGLIIRQHV